MQATYITSNPKFCLNTAVNSLLPPRIHPPACVFVIPQACNFWAKDVLIIGCNILETALIDFGLLASIACAIEIFRAAEGEKSLIVSCTRSIALRILSSSPLPLRALFVPQAPSAPRPPTAIAFAAPTAAAIKRGSAMTQNLPIAVHQTSFVGRLLQFLRHISVREV